MGGKRVLDPDRNLFDWAAVELQKLRKLHDHSHMKVAMVIGKDRTLVSKIESGESRLQEEDADTLDQLWDTGGRLGRIVRLAKSRHSSEWLDDRAHSESRADHVRIWALGWIPVLAQIPDYARAVFAECRRQDIEAATKASLARQAILQRKKPPLAWLQIDQDALEHAVGGRDVHRRQLAHLLELAESPLWTVRVVPRSAGGHVGRDGSFELYRVNGAEIAYTETLGPGRLIRDPEEVALYDIWFRRIGDVAESTNASRALIRRIMEEFT